MSVVELEQSFVRRKHTPKCVRALRDSVRAVSVWLRFWCSLSSPSLPSPVVSFVRWLFEFVVLALVGSVK